MMKKKSIKILLLMILFSFTLIGVYYDDFLYKKEIIKITKIDKIGEDTSENTLGLEEKYYQLIIIGKVTNGINKGKMKKIQYEESFSSVVTDHYQINDKIIIDHGEIEGLKRDFYVWMMVSIFIILIYIVGEYKGLLSVFSVILNAIIFYLGLLLYFKGVNLLFLCILESVLFSIFSLCISNGWNLKTKSAIISVIISVLLISILLIIVSKVTNYSGVLFNELEFLTVPVEDVLLPELLIGCMGAVMDVAITISSAISELVKKNRKITIVQLKKSSKEIGKDIMSTMTNVLFFTYLCAGLPMFVLAIRNGYSFMQYITTNYSLEITRFLVGSIGIVGAIPISTFISIYFFKEEIK